MHDTEHNDFEHSAPQDAWLSAFPDLAAIQDEAWLSARRAAKEFVIPAGTIMMRQGGSTPGFILFAKGSTRIYERAENGREIALYRTLPGEMCLLTLINLLADTTYSAEAMVEDELHVVRIPIENFREALTQSDGFRQVLCSTLVQRLNDLIHLVGRVAFQRLDLRLAQLLHQLFLARNATRLSVTHQKLAQELGTSREVASRLLKELEHQGYIRLHRGEIELVSVADLARLSTSHSA
jgi:CRP/FNR family transcriptional regulator